MMKNVISFAIGVIVTVLFMVAVNPQKCDNKPCKNQYVCVKCECKDCCKDNCKCQK